MVLADAQTSGRGRFDRAWMALPGKGLTFSLVLKNPGWIPLGSNLGQIAAVAVMALLERFHIPAQLKWPNDVMVNGRKIAGILVERAEHGFVVGIGLNVNVTATDFAKAGLDRPATSMMEAAGLAQGAARRPCPPESRLAGQRRDAPAGAGSGSALIEVGEVLTGLLEALGRCLELAREQGLAPLWAMWSRHDWLAGRSIRICGSDGERVVGEYLGISPEGGLRLRTLEGYEKVFWTGDVERVITAASG